MSWSLLKILKRMMRQNLTIMSRHWYESYIALKSHCHTASKDDLQIKHQSMQNF